METKKMNFDQMENLNGGDNLDNAVCTFSTAAWAVGSLTVATGLGLAVWVAGAVGVAYCNSQMVS